MDIEIEQAFCPFPFRALGVEASPLKSVSSRLRIGQPANDKDSISNKSLQI